MIGLSSYKLVKFLKNYINPEKIEISVIIYFFISQKWLYKLEFQYKEVHKDMFIVWYEWLDGIKD